MGNILICVPSKGRVDSIQKQTLAWLQYSKYDWMVFVEPQEYDQYAEIVPSDKLFELPENNKGLGYSKLIMKEVATELGYDYIFKMDDDTCKWAHPGVRGNNTRRKNGEPVFVATMEMICHEVFDPMVDKCIQALDQMDEVGGITFKYRNEVRECDLSIDFDSINKRFQSCYIVRTHLLLGKYQTYDDFMCFFNVRKEGYITLTYHRTGMDYIPIGSNSGGIQSFNRRQAALAEKEEIEREYGDLVKWKSVDKDWDYEPDVRAMRDFVQGKGIQITL